MTTIYVLADLGYGDSVKGGTTHYLCHKTGARTVVRTGGPQAFHRVVCSDGREFTFSQFGSGTPLGAETYLQMVIEPYALLQEGRAVRTELGIADPFGLITIHEGCLVITPFQAIANRLLELARRENRHGTVGIGVGETVLDSEVLGDMAIRASDFSKPWLSEKLEAIRQHKLQQLAPILEQLHELPEKAKEEAAKLYDQRIVGWATAEFNNLAGVVNIDDGSYLDYLLRSRGTIVCEPSQGILLNRWLGWHPHTTKVETSPAAALGILAQHGYQGRIIRLGLLRAYQTRHGAGPFVTEDAELTKQLPDPTNGEHEWQGKWRVGQFDAVAIRYAIEACGGTGAFDGLVVSCLDRLKGIDPWQICTSYTLPPTGDLSNFFVVEGRQITGIKVRPNSQDDAHLRHQEELGRLLRQCQPNFINLGTSGGPNYETFLGLIEEQLGVHVAIASYGPTEQDKQEACPL